MLTPWLAHAQFDKTAWPRQQPTPQIQGVDLQGQHWTSADLKGRTVVLNFWASWCAPCIEELPSLQALHDSGSESPLVLGINVKETAAKVIPFLARNGIRFPVLLDPQGDMARQWGVRIYPTTLLIGPNGQARWRVVGDLDWNGALAQAWLNELKKPAPQQTLHQTPRQMTGSEGR